MEFKNLLIMWGIILIVVAIGMLIIFYNPKVNIDSDVVKCIGENSQLFTQNGCSFCLKQQKLFGDRYSLLNVTDCLYNTNECLLEGIEKTPTWIINGTKYGGVQSIDKLRNLTGC